MEHGERSRGNCSLGGVEKAEVRSLETPKKRGRSRFSHMHLPFETQGTLTERVDEREVE